MMSKGKSGSGSMAALQEGRGGKEYGQVTVSGGSSSSVDSKFHNRPKSSKGTELSMDVNKGDGLCK
jgi:hypothetical protein